MRRSLALAIGSAGAGIEGVAKEKNPNSSLDLLDTKQDIEFFKEFCLAFDGLDSTFEWFGSFEVCGNGGSKEVVLKTLHEFFDKCKNEDYKPLIYYTGHGDKNGDWCFRNGDRITFDDLYDYHESHHSGYNVTVFSDCCYSGQWVVQSRRQQKMIVKSASGPHTTAYNGVFSRGFFHHDATAMSTIRERGASGTFWDDKTNTFIVCDIQRPREPVKCICCRRPTRNNGFMCSDGLICQFNQCNEFDTMDRCIRPIGRNGTPGKFATCRTHRARELEAQTGFKLFNWNTWF